MLAAARETGAQAIHPGYGFLSENADFARACADAGIVFVGPGERALEVMGDKIRAKEHVAAHGVPTCRASAPRGCRMPRSPRPPRRRATRCWSSRRPAAAARACRSSRSPGELPDALATARRVAAAAFGDDTLLLERLIERPRHIEVQVLADAHGTVIHLGERECTLQRRHQKVIEEAPSPVVDSRDARSPRRGRLRGRGERRLPRRGHGRVPRRRRRPDEFFFIEMNTRLQVEHPVTELVTGLDLVEQQLRIAAGEPLALAQDDVRLDGHAIEARVYAESPERGFLPATGDVLVWRPADGVRTDAAVESGSVVSADYDPMIAKVIAHGADRAEAIARLDAALAETVLLGVDTNIAFLRELLADAGVRAGRLDTGLIDRMPPYTAPRAGPRRRSARPPSPARSLACAAREPVRAASGALWLAGSGWRASGAPVGRTVAIETEDGGIVVVAAPDLALVTAGHRGSRPPRDAVEPDGADALRRGRWRSATVGRALAAGRHGRDRRRRLDSGSTPTARRIASAPSPVARRWRSASPHASGTPPRPTRSCAPRCPAPSSPSTSPTARPSPPATASSRSRR